MLQKKFFNILTESEIRTLPGGPKHNFHYFIGFLEKPHGDLFIHAMYAKLRKQMGSQRSSRL
jgi:hypothetical protein